MSPVPGNFHHDSGDNFPLLEAEPPSENNKRHLLDLVTDELEAKAACVTEYGLSMATIFPADQLGKLDLFAHVDGQVDPARPNLLATIVHVEFGANRFVGPHKHTLYDVLVIPDGLHMIKSSGIADTDKMHPLAPEGSTTLADETEAYLALKGLIEQLSTAISLQQEARSIEAAIGTDFVSETDVQELIGLLEGPRVDPFGKPLK